MARVEAVELDVFVDCGMELLGNSWEGQGAVELDAPTEEFDRQQMRTFVDYLACGREMDPDTGEPLQLNLQHRKAQDRADARAEDDGFTILRDYDSVLAVSATCPVKNTPIELYHIPNFKKGLNGTTHLKLQFSTDGGNHVAQDPASHTTCLFATFGASSRNDLYLCFPSDAAKDSAWPVMQAAIYDAAREAQGDIYPENTHEYAATFEAEMARAPNNASKIILPRHGVGIFISTFAENLKSECPWALSMYFLAQIRGVKDNFRHDGACKQTLRRLLENIKTDASTVVYVDVGLEVKVNPNPDPVDGDEILWSSLPINNLNAHLRVMGIDPEHMEGVTKFTDLWCMTTDISGFRLDATRRPGGVGPHRVVYAQVYVTDKFATYHAGNNRTIHPKDLLKMTDTKNSIHGASKMVRIFNDNQTVPVHVRYELRVPFAHAHLALWGVEDDEENIRGGDIDFTGAYALYQTVHVWGYRLLNVAALIWIAKELAGVLPPDQRSSQQSLVLAAGIAYLLNSTVARPSDRSEWKAVAYAVFPQSRVQAIGRHFLWNLPRTQETRVPYFEHGKGWMPQIMWPGEGGTNLRLFWAEYRAFSDEQILKIFDTQLPEIRARFTNTGRISLHDLGGQKRRCKGPQMLLGSEPEQPAAAKAIIFNHVSGFDDRGDLPAEDMFDDRWMGDRHPTAIFIEVLSQLIQRSGVTLMGESFSTLSLDQQCLVGLATFRDPNVLVYWRSRMVAWKHCNNFRPSWDLLLPVSGGPVKHLEHTGWKAQTAWQQLMALRTACPRPYDAWRTVMIPELERFQWFFALDSSKCFEKKLQSGWNSIHSTEGTKPSQMLRILVKIKGKLAEPADKTPVLDASMLAQYIEEKGLDEAAVLGQHAPSLSITDAQREDLTRIPGRRVPTNFIALREEEEESSGAENE
ncbi:hypothetical protein B0H16DRAFT_1793600 [Mycena metata]|uniref:Uncharacterized protein n=1 Tax=Mycena metata TaxID=1033252 RepID=A0AAD7MJI6_9AGAR|nr:hypothetical protein B0H16DRAFT_1793600 [Mycena metata]